MTDRSRRLLTTISAFFGVWIVIVALPTAWKPLWLPSALRSPTLHLGLDLAGGTQLDYRISETEMADQIRQLREEVDQLESSHGNSDTIADKRAQIANIEDLRANIVESLRVVLERRINSLGVSEAVITPAIFGEEKHLLVECPGIIEVQQCIETVGKTILLEFKEEHREEEETTTQQIREKVTGLRRTMTQSGKTLQQMAFDLQGDLAVQYLEDSTFRDTLPTGLEDLWGRTPGDVLQVEGSLPALRTSGDVESLTLVRGTFLAEATGPRVLTGRSITDMTTILQTLDRESPVLKLIRHEEEVPSVVSPRLAPSLAATAARSLTGVLLAADDARLLYLQRHDQPSEVMEASHILIAYRGALGTSAASRTKEEALTLAGDLRRRLEAGESFTTLAQEFSDDPTTRGNGGFLGAFERGKMVYAFEQAAFALPITGISDPVETPYGYHLIRGDRAPYRPEARTSFLELQIQERDAQPRLTALLQELADGSIQRDQESLPFRAIFFSHVPTGWKDTSLDGKHFRRAAVTSDPITGLPVVQITFDTEGGSLFHTLTKGNVGKRIAIFVGGDLVSAPTVQEEIPGGTAVITGIGSFDDARRLSQDLNTGAIPAPIHLVGQVTVEPTLGAAELRDSVRAGALGFLLIAIFMVWYYRVLGLLAILALIAYTALFVAMLKLPLLLLSSQYIVLTLAGVAGVLMTIGMALDANVLIFERMKEELGKGKLFRTAVDIGFRRAWSAIWDSNVTTLLTALILFLIGTSIVRGFAVTLSLGIPLSMFTAICITRWLIRHLEKTPIVDNLEAFGVRREGESHPAPEG